MKKLIPRELIKHLIWSPGMESTKPQSNSGINTESIASPLNITIQSSPDFWTVSGVQYRDEIYTVDLAKTLLDRGNSKTQDEWSAYANEAQAKGEFYTGDMPLQHALFTAVYKIGDNPIKEEIKEFVKKSMIEKWLMTLTRIQYQPEGSLEDVIIHNRGMPDEYSVKENFVFLNEYAEESKRPSNYMALLGIDDLQEINSVYHWITDKRAFLWRVNERDNNNVIESVTGFVAYSYGARLVCGRFPSGRDASLGVRSSSQKIKGGK